MIDYELVLSESPDGKITSFRILDWEEKPIEVVINIPFRHQEHLSYLKEAYKKGHLEFDLRSRIARLGFDIRFKAGDLKFDPSRKEANLTGAIFPWTDDYFPDDGSWHELFAYKGLSIGKLVNLDSRLEVSNEELEARIKEGVVRLKRESRLTKGGIFIPLDRKREGY